MERNLYIYTIQTMRGIELKQKIGINKFAINSAENAGNMKAAPKKSMFLYPD